MIDIHTHPVMMRELVTEDARLLDAVHNVFGFHFPPQPLDLFQREMEAAGVDQAVLLPIDCTTRHGCCLATNEQVAELCERYPQFIGFASVDPNLGRATSELDRAVRQLGLRGLKLDPALQGFRLDDERTAYPLYEGCVGLGIPILIHCGMSWAPSGQAQRAHPLALEAVAQAFPGLRIIVAHFAWPWVQEAVMLALKYPNVYLDTAILFSGTPTEAYRRVLIQQVGREVLEQSLRDKIIFGSNYPRVDIRRSVQGIRALDLTPSLQENLLWRNAQAVLNAPRREE